MAVFMAGLVQAESVTEFENTGKKDSSNLASVKKPDRPGCDAITNVRLSLRHYPSGAQCSHERTRSQTVQGSSKRTLCTGKNDSCETTPCSVYLFPVLIADKNDAAPAPCCEAS